MKSKLITFFVVTVCLVALTGCTTLKGNIPFQYQPSLINVSQTINKNVGFTLAKDERPQSDINSLKTTIKDLPNKVTYKIMEDFRASSIFNEVNFPPKPSDDIIINPTLHRFNWRVDTNWFAVLFGPLIYFGLPVEDHVGEAEISLEIVDNRSNDVLGTITGSGSQRLTYSLYNISVGECGSELAEAFRQTTKELKEKILSDIEF